MQHSSPLCPARTPLKKLLALVGLLAVVGCGSGEPFDYVKVSGKVSYEDGMLIDADRVTVVFIPLDAPATEGSKPRSGMAEVNVSDGTFDSATSHRYGDGILAGRHRVLIVALGARQELGILPPEYSDSEKTPLEVDTADSPFHFKVKRLQ